MPVTMNKDKDKEKPEFDDDISATGKLSHIGLELGHRFYKIVGGQNLTFWCQVSSCIPKSVTFKYFNGIRNSHIFPFSFFWVGGQKWYYWAFLTPQREKSEEIL